MAENTLNKTIFCPECGQKIMFCRIAITGDFIFCNECGTKINLADIPDILDNDTEEASDLQNDDSLLPGISDENDEISEKKINLTKSSSFSFYGESEDLEGDNSLPDDEGEIMPVKEESISSPFAEVDEDIEGGVSSDNAALDEVSVILPVNANNGSSPFAEETDESQSASDSIQHDRKNKAAKASEKKQSGASPFSEVNEDEEKAIREKISSAANNWRKAIKDSYNTESMFTDNFAKGMPDWDLTPPDTLIRRREAKKK